MKFFFVTAAFGAVIGCVFLMSAFNQPGAPQQAAAAAIAIAFAVIPYVFARAVEKITGPHAVRIISDPHAGPAPVRVVSDSPAPPSPADVFRKEPRI